MPTIHYIHPTFLTLNDINTILKEGQALTLSEQTRLKTEAGYLYLKKKITETDQTYYGINTGFGSLCHVKIPQTEISTLQKNLVRSHACGVGEEVPEGIVRIMLLLKIQSLSHGYSGVSVPLIEQLLDFYNQQALPVVYQLGSLGASGDLAPLAHLSLPLIGEGALRFKNQLIDPPQYFKEKKRVPLELEAKEGLALLNGTQFSTAYATWCLLEAERLAIIAHVTAAISLEAFDAKAEPFDAKLHAIRPHKGQIKVAKTIKSYLKGSKIASQAKKQVQDPYAFRCIPQVHGASEDVIAFVKQTVETEINAVTDNPTIFPEEDAILSGGNFHAQPIALAMDFLAIALSELGSISERRVFQLLSGQRGLPVYLCENGGIESGMMITQYTAASIVSQNKQLCTPASVDSIVSSNGQEDHVSMSANAATKCYKVVENLERLLAIEWMVAMQALDFRSPLQSSKTIENWHQSYRKMVPILRGDRILHYDILKTIEFLRQTF